MPASLYLRLVCSRPCGNLAYLERVPGTLTKLLVWPLHPSAEASSGVKGLGSRAAW